MAEFSQEALVYFNEDTILPWDHVRFTAELMIASCAGELVSLVNSPDAAVATWQKYMGRIAALADGRLNPDVVFDAEESFTFPSWMDQLAGTFSTFLNDNQANDDLPEAIVGFAHLGWHAFEEARRRACLSAGVPLERRVLSESGCCRECEEASFAGWTAIGTLPAIGDCSCTTVCRCHFDYAAEDDDTAEFGFLGAIGRRIGVVGADKDIDTNTTGDWYRLEPRDEQGRWTSGGSSSVGSASPGHHDSMSNSRGDKYVHIDEDGFVTHGPSHLLGKGFDSVEKMGKLTNLRMAGRPEDIARADIARERFKEMAPKEMYQVATNQYRAGASPEHVNKTMEALQAGKDSIVKHGTVAPDAYGVAEAGNTGKADASRWAKRLKDDPLDLMTQHALYAGHKGVIETTADRTKPGGEMYTHKIVKNEGPSVSQLENGTAKLHPEHHEALRKVGELISNKDITHADIKNAIDSMKFLSTAEAQHVAGRHNFGEVKDARELGDRIQNAYKSKADTNAQTKAMRAYHLDQVATNLEYLLAKSAEKGTSGVAEHLKHLAGTKSDEIPKAHIDKLESTLKKNYTKAQLHDIAKEMDSGYVGQKKTPKAEIVNHLLKKHRSSFSETSVTPDELVVHFGDENRTLAAAVSHLEQLGLSDTAQELVLSFCEIAECEDNEDAEPVYFAASTQVQTLLFPKDEYDEDSIRAFCKKNNFTASKFDTTENFIRVRQFDPGKCQSEPRTIPFKNSKGVKAVICQMPPVENSLYALPDQDEFVWFDGYPFLTSTVSAFLFDEGYSDEDVLSILSDCPTVEAQPEFSVTEDFTKLVNGSEVTFDASGNAVAGPSDLVQWLTSHDDVRLAVFASDPDFENKHPRGGDPKNPGRFGSGGGGGDKKDEEKSGKKGDDKGGEKKDDSSSGEKKGLGKRLVERIRDSEKLAKAKEVAGKVKDVAGKVKEVAKEKVKETAVGKAQTKLYRRYWGEKKGPQEGETPEQAKARNAERAERKIKLHKEFVASYIKRLDDKIKADGGTLREHVKLAILKGQQKLGGKVEGAAAKAGVLGLMRWGVSMYKHATNLTKEVGKEYDKRLVDKYGEKAGGALKKLVTGLHVSMTAAFTLARFGVPGVAALVGAFATGGIGGAAIAATTGASLVSGLWAAKYALGHSSRRFFYGAMVNKMTDAMVGTGKAIARGDVKALAKTAGGAALGVGKAVGKGLHAVARGAANWPETIASAGKAALQPIGRVLGHGLVKGAEGVLHGAGAASSAVGSLVSKAASKIPDIHSGIGKATEKLGISQSKLKESRESLRRRPGHEFAMFADDGSDLPDDIDQAFIRQLVLDGVKKTMDGFDQIMLENQSNLEPIMGDLDDIDTSDMEQSMMDLAQASKTAMAGLVRPDQQPPPAAPPPAGGMPGSPPHQPPPPPHPPAASPAGRLKKFSLWPDAIFQWDEDLSEADRESVVSAILDAAHQKRRMVTIKPGPILDAAKFFIDDAKSSLEAMFGPAQTREILAAGVFVPEPLDQPERVAPLLVALSAVDEQPAAWTEQYPRLPSEGIVDLGYRVMTRILDAWRNNEFSLPEEDDIEIDELLGIDPVTFVEESALQEPAYEIDGVGMSYDEAVNHLLGHGCSEEQILELLSEPS